MDNPIYSKLETQNVISAKRNILLIQTHLLDSLQKIENYKELRKKELLLKLKLKNDLKKVKENFIKINNHVPQTKGIKKPKMIHANKMREKEVKRNSSVQEQLIEIQQRLNELS